MTTQDTIQENEQVLEEMMRDALEAPEPGTTDRVINRPTADNPLPMTAGQLGTAGWVYVWNKFTGDRSLCNRNHLAVQLTKRDDEGRLCFTTRDPGIVPDRGHTLCMLHKDHPDRPHHAELGLPLCPAGNLRNDYNMRLHMQHRHKNEWGTLQEELRLEIEAEERAVRRAIIGGTAAPAPIVPAPGVEVTKACVQCGDVFAGNTVASVNRKLGQHKRKAHPKT